MILREHKIHHDRFRPYYQGPMLMLGNQENVIGYDFGVPYVTLDPDEGNLSWDLNVPIPDEWVGVSKTVYNLGTLEHVWNIHQAFQNAARMVAPMGFYLHHGPCAGYEGHGIHVTDWKMVNNFFELNGFRILEYWFTRQDGSLCPPPERNSGSCIFWMVAKKNEMLSCSFTPQQVFKGGVKQ